MIRKSAINLYEWNTALLNGAYEAYFYFRKLTPDKNSKVRIDVAIGNCVFTMRGTYDRREATEILDAIKAHRIKEKKA